MNPRIETISPKKIVGHRIRTTLANDKTSELWRKFRAEKANVSNIVSAKMYSVKVYDQLPDFRTFTPETEFEKWAAYEVTSTDLIPHGMEMHELPGGLYAVFIHRGPMHSFNKTLQYIFGSWMPTSGYITDHREHFEILPEDYDPFSENMEEEVWIPIRQK